MPYADNQGVRLYYEIDGEGPPVVMAHGMGFGGNLNAWRTTGYTEVLKNDFQLILFDLRGHGRSDKPSRAAAEQSDPADDVVTVLDREGIIRAQFFGYSMGAAAGFNQAVRHADRFSSFILGGITPGPWPEEMVRASRISAELAQLRRNDPEAYFQQMEHLTGHPLTPEDKRDLLSRDDGAEERGAAQGRAGQPLSPGQLAGITVPCILYCGSQDLFYAGAQESVQHMPRAAFISLDGLNHITAFSRSDVILRFARPFLLRISQMTP